MHSRTAETKRRDLVPSAGEALLPAPTSRPNMDQLKSQQAMSVALDKRTGPVRTGVVQHNYLKPS
jgi:hypothetical protein